MITVLIDVSTIVEDFNINQAQVNDLLDSTVKAITYRFAEEWRNEANRTLKSARQEYIANIHVVDDGFAKGSVVLTGWLPNSIEEGLGSYDMKPGLLSGPNAKTGKDGARYNTVPFTFGTPGALAENFSSIMPKDIYDVIKGKPQDKMVQGGGKSTKPLTLDEIPVAFQMPEVKKVVLPGSKSIVDYQHKNSIYEGMVRVKDSATNQNSYKSFRRVSDNSDEASWIHPGFPSETSDIAGKALKNFDVPALTGQIIDEWLSNL